MKYEIGDFVSKPVTGICKIENILYLNSQDEKNDKLYYLMKPVEDEKEKIYADDSFLAFNLAHDFENHVKNSVFPSFTVQFSP